MRFSKVKQVKWLIFSIFNGKPPHIKAMIKTALDQYEEIVTDALKSCSAKLRKSFKFQSRERRLLISASSGRDALLQ